VARVERVESKMECGQVVKPVQLPYQVPAQVSMFIKSMK